ncbi:MAG: hypothetical protein WD100_14350, partial [Tistlia sp.]
LPGASPGWFAGEAVPIAAAEKRAAAVIKVKHTCEGVATGIRPRDRLDRAAPPRDPQRRLPATGQARRPP